MGVLTREALVPIGSGPNRIDHLEVLAYLWQSTGVSLCSDKTIGQGRGAEAGVIAATAPS